MKLKTEKQNNITLPECGMFIGSPIYLDRGDYVFQHTGQYYTSWVSEDHDPEWYMEQIVKENQGNLAIIWDGSATKTCLKSMADWLDLKGLGYEIPEPDWENKAYLTPDQWGIIAKHPERLGAGFYKLIKKAEKLGLYSYSIYSEANAEWVQKLNNINSFLGYNCGEKFSFDIEDDGEKTGLRVNKENLNSVHDLRNIAANFSRSVKEFFSDKKSEGWKNFFITAASFHLDAEIAAGGSDIIPHIESFAFSNLNFASALCRGVYKQFDLPLWGNYLAHEHYSFLPYSSIYKFKMLDASFLLSYMSGSKITVLESGNWWQQTDHVDDTAMHDTPKIDLGPLRNNDPQAYAHLVPEARKHYAKLNYNSDICKTYRKSLSDFYDFVKTNGTPDGQPEIALAAVKGNFDFCSNSYSPNCAIAGAYNIAEQNPLWYEGMPERSWELFRQVFFPLNNILGEYVNSYISGTPYGMTDIVSLAGELSANFLNSNYKALLFSGWNTANEKQYELMKQYVFNGGTLFISIPHLSKNTTRNYTNYPVSDLVNGGDFSELCGVRVKKRGKQIYWMLAAENNILGLSRHTHFGPFATHIGEIELIGKPDIIAIHDETFTPTLIRHQYGKGCCYFLNSWEYPGALDIHTGPGAKVESQGLVGEIYRKIATDCRGNVYITDDGISTSKECDFISFSYFSEAGKIYLYNIDFKQSRNCFLHQFGVCNRIELAPGEFRVIDCKKDK